MRRLYLFSSRIERDAALPNGVPDGVLTGITGVGLIDAGISTVELVRETAPQEIIYLGTCGAYPTSGLTFGDCVIGGEVSVGSGETVTGDARIPKLLPSQLYCDAERSRQVQREIQSEVRIDISSVHVHCTLGITETDELAARLDSEGAVENLELFSVLRAAGKLPVVAMLGVTNIVGAGGGADWMKNYEEQMRRIASFFFD